MKKTTRISRTIKCVFGKYRCKSGKRRIRNDWIFINEYSIVTDDEKYWCETHRKKVQNMVKQNQLLKNLEIEHLEIKNQKYKKINFFLYGVVTLRKLFVLIFKAIILYRKNNMYN